MEGTAGCPRWALLTVLAAYTAFVAALSHTSQPPLPTILLHLPDKVLHAVEYVPFGFLSSRLSRGSLRRRLVLGWAAACAFGLVDEVHQAFVPGRHAGLGDWVAGRRRRRRTSRGGRQSLAGPAARQPRSSRPPAEGA